MLVLLLATTVFIFGMSRASGDPRSMYLDRRMSGERWEELGKAMGLDRPIYVQYGIWLAKVFKGDFGKSLHMQRDAMVVVRERLPATIQLGFGALIFTVFVGLPLGVLSAVSRGTVFDYVGRSFALLGQAMPGFWLGIMLIFIFAVHFGWLPTGRRGGLDHYILPSITLGWYTAAGLLRLVRSSMLEVLDSEYVKLARAKGVRPWLLIWKHAFRNALISPLTYAGLLIGGFLTGTVVTETVFAWPGVGRLTISAVMNNDFPVMAAAMLFFTVIYVSTALFVDLLYLWVDPRIRLS